MWDSGRLVAPAALQHLPALNIDRNALAPLGMRPSSVVQANVPTYPAGWPLIIAATSQATGLTYAPYVATAAMFAVLILATAFLAAWGARAGAGAALFSALLVAASPVFFYHAIHPMSDVPATALWMSAWALALNRTGASALASGLIVAIAILARPNLAPLAVVLVPLWLPLGTAKRPLPYAPLCTFLVSSGLGAVLLLTLQHQLYGSWLSTSYADAASFFDLTRFEVNLTNYFGMVVDQAGWPAVALLTMWIGLAVTLVGPREPRVVSSALGLAAMTFLLYAFYLPFEHWPFLRFMMPGLAALAVLAGRGWHAEVERTHGLRQQLTVAAGVATLVLAASHRPDLWNYSWNAWRDQQRNVAMSSYLAAALPSRSVVLGFVHTGVIASQTGRDVIRLDLVEPAQLESVVFELRRHGLHAAFVLDSQIEVDEFRRRFASTPYGALDWPPRARFQGAFDTKYWLAEDTGAPGPPYATDVLNVVE